MTELALVAAKYGFFTLVGLVLLYILLHGEVHFKYPRKGNSGPKRAGRKPAPRS
jgi:hypothetical protein